MEEELYGASGTNPKFLAGMGVLNSLSGGRGDLVQQYVNEAVPLPKKADPYVAALKFFIEMGKQASQPGATVLGSITGSMGAPVDYLEAKALERQKAEQARSALGLQIAPSLKPEKATGSGTSVQVVGPDGKPQFMSTAEAIRTGAEPYIEPKSSTASIVPKDYVVEAENGITIADVLYPKGTKLQLTDQQRSMFGPSDLASPAAGSSSEPKALTELAKLYDDLNAAEPNSEEAERIQEQINAIAKEGGFNKDIFGAEADLRKEWQKFETPFNQIKTNHEKLKTALQRQSGVGDMSSIFIYMKMLDPGSVVRESEFAQAQQTAGAVESLIVRMNQIAVGDKLSPEQRKEFLDLANEFYNLSKAHIGQNRLNLGTIVQNNPSLKPSNIFGSELAPPTFYANFDVFRTARDAGLTMDDLWNEMTDDEKAEYLP
jgi:hypothetical protein